MKKEGIKDRIEKNNLYEKVVDPPIPKNMLIEITNICNHKCVFCENRKNQRKGGFIDRELLERVLKEAYSLGVREVGYYTTGEPMVNPHIVEYVELAKNIGYDYVYITTNGALLTEEKMILLADAGIDSIKFSINAGTRETYEVIHGKDDFEVVLKNLKYMSSLREKKGYKYRLYASYVSIDKNRKEYEILYKLISEYVDEIITFEAGNQGGNMYEIKEFTSYREKTSPCKEICSMPFNRIHITYEGYLSMCCVDFHNYLAVSDLNETSLKDAWLSSIAKDFRKRHMDGNLEGTMCFNCMNYENRASKPIVEKYATYYEKDLKRDIRILKDRLI